MVRFGFFGSPEEFSPAACLDQVVFQSASPGRDALWEVFERDVAPSFERVGVQICVPGRPIVRRIRTPSPGDFDVYHGQSGQTQSAGSNQSTSTT